ncbi:costunolide synthase-like [Aegilops tauschii subsp. strangulata]|uniref:costunolide synthase-like n=1 Tax=Aegilops tauschii subsp. strangulata TaxID=200361 RepID=UPI003CC88066
MLLRLSEVPNIIVSTPEAAMEVLKTNDLVFGGKCRQQEAYGPLPVVAAGADIFGAATYTTAATLEWAMAELMHSPKTMARAKLELQQKLGHHRRPTITKADLGDLHYLQMVIKETLRSPLPSTTLTFELGIQDYNDDGRTDIGNLFFAVDPYACNQVITHTMPTRYDRDIDVTFVPMYRAIQANMCVSASVF